MEAIVKQTNGAFVIIPATPAGLVTGEQLLKIAQLVNEGAGLAKFTTGQRVAIITTEDKIDSVRQGLESVGLKIGPVGDVVRNVKGCTGSLCKWAKQDALKHAIELDGAFAGREMPFALKISVSGCPKNCMEARCNDIGFLGTPSGYKLYIGGKGGGKQELGQLLAEGVVPEDMKGLVSHIIDVYLQNAVGREKLTTVIQRAGLDTFKK